MDFQTTFFFVGAEEKVSAGSPIRHSHPSASGTDSDEEGKNNIAFFFHVLLLLL
jgi:hypothetical protein